MRRLDSTVEAAIIKAYESSPSGGRTLASRLGVGATTLYRVLRRNNVPIAEEKRHGRSVRRYALTQEQEEEVVERYRGGDRSKSLAKRFGCSRETILAMLRRHGATGVIGRPKREQNPEQLQRAVTLAAKGLSQTAIAKQMGVCQGTVSGWLRIQGIDRSGSWRGPKSGASWKGGRSRTPYGYIQVTLSPGDPFMTMAQSRGYVLEHRLVMARQLGRPLLPSESVHHINGIKDDNRPENLELRIGKHGTGVAMVCADCGSHNVRTCGLKTANVN